MPAAGYTPILLYGSTTASAVPAAANLTNGTGGSEIAINITDGRLYYKDNNGAVQLIGAKLNSVLAAALSSAPVGSGSVVLASGVTGTGNVVLASALGSYAALAGSTSQQFSVADATAATQATSLGQLTAGLATKAALAGSTTQAFSVANATAATQAVARQQVVGAGATAYSNVTSSRALSTTYTNSTGRPLFITVTVTSSTAAGTPAQAYAFVNGAQIQGFTQTTNTGGLAISLPLSFIVPPSGTYEITFSTGNSVGILFWFEY